MYEELIKALKTCNYPGSGYYCSQGCVMSPNGTETCELTPLLRKAAEVIEKQEKAWDKVIHELTVKQYEPMHTEGFRNGIGHSLWQINDILGSLKNE